MCASLEGCDCNNTKTWDESLEIFFKIIIIHFFGNISSFEIHFGYLSISPFDNDEIVINKENIHVQLQENLKEL